MSSPRVTGMDPKYNDKCAYKQIKGESHVETESEIGVMLPHTKEPQQSPGAETGKERFVPRDLRGNVFLLLPRPQTFSL